MEENRKNNRSAKLNWTLLHAWRFYSSRVISHNTCNTNNLFLSSKACKEFEADKRKTINTVGVVAAKDAVRLLENYDFLL